MTSQVRRGRAQRWIAAIVLTIGMGAKGAEACIGDCNGDLTVAINELIQGVNLSLNGGTTGCASFDESGNGQIEINELILGVNNGLFGCAAPVCAGTGEARISVYNRTGQTPVTVALSGTLVAQTCPRGTGMSSAYPDTGEAINVVISDSCGASSPSCSCLGSCICDENEVPGLKIPRCQVSVFGAPGDWLHRIAVSDPNLGQQQAQRTLLVNGSISDLKWTVFPTVFTVASTTGFVPAVEAASRVSSPPTPPVLIRFDHGAFGFGAAAVSVNQSDQLVFDQNGQPQGNREIVVDGTDPLGNPSPLDPFEDRRFNTVVVIQSQASASAGVLELKKRVTLNGLKVIRNLGNDAEIASFQQPVVRVSDGGDRSRVVTTLIDGGADTRTSATSQGIKDCIDVDGTQTTSFAEGFTVEQSELRDCYARGLRVRQGHATVRDSWVHHNHLAGLFADATRGDLQSERNLIERNGWNQNGEVNPEANQIRVFTGTPLNQAASLSSKGDIIRDGTSLGSGIRFDNNGEGTIAGSFLCNTGSYGILTESDPGEKATIAVRGTAAVLSSRGVSIVPTDPPNIDFGTASSIGRNVFTNNGSPGSKNNFGFNAAAGASLSAMGNQWESCGDSDSCLETCGSGTCITRSDVEQGAGVVNVGGSLAHRNLDEIAAAPLVSPRRVAHVDSVVRLQFDKAVFNAVEGYEFGVSSCAAIGGSTAPGNKCSPLQGTCIEFENDAGQWISAKQILGLTPTEVVVTSPIACSRSRGIRIRRKQNNPLEETITYPNVFCQ